MVITSHRKNSINLKLFLETLGFECYFSHVGDTIDELLIIPDGREDFLKQVKDYVESYKFIPYHYCFTVSKEGKAIKDDKVSFEGACIEMVEFQSVSGSFTLMLFESEDNVYLWKKYSKVDQAPKGLVSGRMKAVIKSKEGGVVNLISHCRVK